MNENSTWCFWRTLKCLSHGYGQVVQNLQSPNLKPHRYLVEKINKDQDETKIYTSITYP